MFHCSCSRLEDLCNKEFSKRSYVFCLALFCEFNRNGISYSFWLHRRSRTVTASLNFAILNTQGFISSLKASFLNDTFILEWFTHRATFSLITPFYSTKESEHRSWNFISFWLHRRSRAVTAIPNFAILNTYGFISSLKASFFKTIRLFYNDSLTEVITGATLWLITPFIDSEHRSWNQELRGDSLLQFTLAKYPTLLQSVAFFQYFKVLELTSKLHTSPWHRQLSELVVDLYSKLTDFIFIAQVYFATLQDFSSQVFNFNFTLVFTTGNVAKCLSHWAHNPKTSQCLLFFFGLNIAILSSTAW